MCCVCCHCREIGVLPIRSHLGRSEANFEQKIHFFYKKNHVAVLMCNTYLETTRPVLIWKFPLFWGPTIFSSRSFQGCNCFNSVCVCVRVCVLVCQETVWESFKIFWDRLPEQDEYQDWVSRCMDGSVSVMDIGRFFSQSEEHTSLIRSVSTPLFLFFLFEYVCMITTNNMRVFTFVSFWFLWLYV